MKTFRPDQTGMSLNDKESEQRDKKSKQTL